MANGRQHKKPNAGVNVLSKIPAFKLFRQFGWPKMLPMNVTCSMLYRCNSRCLTCNIWEKRVDYFSVEEWDKTFQSLGKAPYWFTFSGGEPFLRRDIPDIVKAAYDRCHPGIVNIPTNAYATNVVLGSVEKILETCPGMDLIINVSMDEVGKEHDRIRGLRNNFEKATATFQGLKELKKSYPNLNLGIHTVISVFNVERVPEVFEELYAKFQPDQYITEIAEQRVELNTIGKKITPNMEQYAHAVDYISGRLHELGFHGVSKLTESFRLEYYKLAKEWLQQRTQIIPCYAGWASAQISPDGNVWSCAIRAESMGNLREENYDFQSIWFNGNAKKLRSSIKNKECECPLANASYTNMVMSPPTLAHVALNRLRLSKNSAADARDVEMVGSQKP